MTIHPEHSAPCRDDLILDMDFDDWQSAGAEEDDFRDAFAASFDALERDPAFLVRGGDYDSLDALSF